MLIIVNLSSKDALPVSVLQEVDSAFGAVGLKKQVRSVLVPGKEFSVTYEGANPTKERLTSILAPIAERNGITFAIDVEESVTFP